MLFTCHVKSSHLYLYSAFNNTNCVKATAKYQNIYFFLVKGISLLSSVISSSSSVQFKYYLCNQVDDIAGNEVSPTKQARDDTQMTITYSASVYTAE